MQHRDVVGRVVGNDSVVVLRITRRRVERLMTALRTTDEVKTLGRPAISFTNDRKRSVVRFLNGFLSKIEQRFVIHAEAAVEVLSPLVASVAAESDEALPERRGC